MKLIVGLGNPGKKYAHTRHNAGFLVVDALAKKLGLMWKEKTAWKAEIADGTVNETKVVLLKPQTFMNLSGEAVAKAMVFWKIPRTDVAIIYDDADLDFGDVRVRKTGSSGGHNGMQSVIERLGTPDIPRVRVGIGRSVRSGYPLDAWVLEPWTKEESDELPAIVEKAVERVREGL